MIDLFSSSQFLNANFFRKYIDRLGNKTLGCSSTATIVSYNAIVDLYKMYS